MWGLPVTQVFHKEDVDLDLDRVSDFFFYISTYCTQKVTPQKTMRGCSGVIKCKPIKVEDKRRQDDGHSESLVLKFKQLDASVDKFSPCGSGVVE